MIVTNGIDGHVSPPPRTGVYSMNDISTEQEMEFSKVLDLLAEMVAKRLDQKPITVNTDLIEEIVAEVTSNSDFQREVEEHASDAVRGMDFSISVI